MDKQMDKQMRGTDKQLKWARAIQSATLDAIDYIIAQGQKYKGMLHADAMLNKLADQRDAVANCEYAGDMIDCFARVGRQDKPEDRAMAFSWACGTVKPISPVQCRMLGQSADQDAKPVNIDRASLDRAAADTVDYAGGLPCNEICYNLGTGKVSVIARTDCSTGMTRHADPKVITVDMTYKHVDADYIERCIIREVRLIQQYT